MKVGFVGAGWMGSVQLRRLAERGDVDIAYLVEPDTGRARTLLAELDLPRTQVVSSFDRVVDDPEVDAVWLVSPNSFHGPQSIAAMKAGKHVFCEKPASISFDQHLEQIRLDRQNPHLITFVDYILYFDSFEQRLRDMIRMNAFGKVTQIQVNYRHPINIAGDKKWKLSREIMGDAIGMGINHAISVIVLAMESQARPVGVVAMSMPAQVRPFEAESIWTILIRFDNGATGVCLGNIDHSNGYDAYHSVSGTNGELVFDGRLDPNDKVRFWSQSLTRGKWIYPLDAARCERDEVEAWPAGTTTPDSGNVIEHQTGQCVAHFISAVESGKKSPLSFANSRTIADIGWAAQISAKLGIEVKLPLDETFAREFLCGEPFEAAAASAAGAVGLLK